MYSLILVVTLRENPAHALIKETPIASGEKKPSLFSGLSVLFSTWAFWIILFYFAAPSLPGWATKNWLPTLFSESLNIPMSEAGPISTITIAFSSFIGVIVGGILSDRWVQKNIRGRVYTGAIGLGLTIPALMLLGFGHSFAAVIGAGLLFGIGFGIFDANNMPILCQFVSAKHRGTAYGYRVIRKMDRWRKLGTRICHAQYYSTGSVGFATLLSSSSDRQYGIIITLMILRNKKYGKDYWFD